MKGFDTDIGSADRAFKQAPEVLDAVSMDVAVHVTLSMVNDLVDVFTIKPIVRRERVGKDFASLRYMLANLSLQSIALAVGKNLSSNLCLSFQGRGVQGYP